MTTSAPQWPGQKGMQERGSLHSDSPAAPELRVSPGLRVVPDGVPRRLEPLLDPVPRPERPAPPHPIALPDPAVSPGPSVLPEPSVLPDPSVLAVEQLDRVGVRRGRRAAGRRGRFVVVRDPAERELWEQRRRGRARLPSPAAVTRDIALALLEVEAGCRSAGQLERIFSPELWEVLEHRIGRRGGPLPSGRSLVSVHCQEDRPGLADTVAVVHRGDLVRPVALRLDAGGGRWRVTELRWWRNETDTTTTPRRDGRSSC